MVRIICLSSISKDFPKFIDTKFFKIMTQNRITKLDSQNKTSQKIKNASETLNAYELSEICIGFDFVEDYDLYLNDIKKKIYLMYIYRKDTSLLVIPMEKGAVQFQQISNGIYEIIIFTSKLYSNDLNYDLRIKIRHIKTTEVRGISKEEENYYINYAQQIEAFSDGNIEEAFERNKFELPNQSEPNVLRTKISDFRKLIELLCNPETGDHDNVPIEKRYHQQVNSVLMPIDQWRVNKPRKITFDRQIKKHQKIRQIRWADVDLKNHNFDGIDTEEIEKIHFEGVTIFNSKKELPKCFQNMEFENLTTLILKNCNITEISDDIAKKLPVTLKQIDFSFNNIMEISKDISKLVKLEILILSNNLLLTTPKIPWEFLPSSILQLDLESTSMAEIPEGIKKLANIQNLTLGSWCLMNISWKDISQTICNLYIRSALFLKDIELKDKCNLKRLYIKKTALKKFDCSCLPDELIELVLDYTLLTKFTCKNSIPNLKDLSLCYNSLTTIPWSDLPTTLETLTFINNDIKTIENISHLINLTSLDAGFNGIRYLTKDITFMRSLKVLNLENNLLSALPTGMENLLNLLILNLEKNEFNYEFHNLKENLWKRLPPKMESLVLNRNNLGELPCYIKNIKILTLSVQTCNLRYICPHLITERRQSQYGFILKISNNPKLETLSVIPAAIYHPSTSERNSENKKSAFIMFTNNDNFLIKTRKKLSYEFSKCKDEDERPSFWCKCCVLCGNETTERIIKQLMIMDFDLNIVTEKEKIINIQTFNHKVFFYKMEQQLEPGKWKTNVITQLCQPCLDGLLKKINDFYEKVLISRYIEGKTEKKKTKIENSEVKSVESISTDLVKSIGSDKQSLSSGSNYYPNAPLKIGSLITLPLPSEISKIEYDLPNNLTTLTNNYTNEMKEHLPDEGNRYYSHQKWNNGYQAFEDRNNYIHNLSSFDHYNFQMDYYGSNSWIKMNNYQDVYFQQNEMNANHYQQTYVGNRWIKEPQAYDEYNFANNCFQLEPISYDPITTHSNSDHSNNVQILNLTNSNPNHPLYSYTPPTFLWLRDTCLRLNIPFMNFIFNEATYVEDLFFYYPDKKLYTKGDGHCGFYTLSLLLCGTPEYHYQLRNIIANHIIYSPINLEEFVWWEDARELAYKDLETDTTKYTNNWMRSIHLAAAADLFGCNILVKCQDRLGWECYNFTTFNYGRNNTIFQSELPCLLIDNSSGNHFEPVITVKKGC